jgi:hypothetical protein
MPGIQKYLLTNEKRGGLTAVSFDRSPVKLFSLKFSNKYVQSSSCERPKTAQRTLFLLFATIILSQHRVKNCWRYLTTAMLLISVRYHTLAETANVAWFVALFEKIFNGEPIRTVFSIMEKDVQYPCFN